MRLLVLSSPLGQRCYSLSPVVISFGSVISQSKKESSPERPVCRIVYQVSATTSDNCSSEIDSEVPKHTRILSIEPCSPIRLNAGRKTLLENRSQSIDKAEI